MAATVRAVVEQLDRRAPFTTAADWDPVGLQVGDPGATVESVVVVHEVTGRVVDRLAAEPADLVVTYHPLIFRPLAHLRAGAHASGRVLRIAASGTAVVAVHTNWDAAGGGTADAMASALGLEGVEAFGSTEAAEGDAARPIGRIGAMAVPATMATLSATVEEVFGAAARWAPATAGTVERVAVLPGSGADFIAEAAAAGAGVLVTGDVSHHRARMAQELGVGIIDPGHAPTERPGVAALYAAVAEMHPEVRDWTAMDASPWESG